MHGQKHIVTYCGSRYGMALELRVGKLSHTFPFETESEIQW